jgi:hypothetical protein
MHRLRIPEIVLGSLLTIAILTLAATIQTFHSNSENADSGAAGASKKITSEAETNERIADYNEALDWLTGVLALSTLGLWWVTWRSGIHQSRDMRAAIAAAQASNEISRQHMIADQRAWLTVTLEATSDLVIDHRGCGFDVSARITNIGKTPALNAHTEMALTLNYDDAVQALGKFSNENRDAMPRWSRVVLPTEHYDRPWRLHAHKIEIEQFNKGGNILPIVVGCVTYQILPDRSVHQTKFIYHMVLRGGPLGELIPMQTAAIEKTHLLCQVHAGGDAD